MVNCLIRYKAKCPLRRSITWIVALRQSTVQSLFFFFSFMMNTQTSDTKSANFSTMDVSCAAPEVLKRNISRSSYKCPILDGGTQPVVKKRLKVGTLMHKRYSVRKFLGSGSFGRVVEAYDLQGKKHVAIKIMKKGCQYTEQAHKEIKILKLIHKEKVNNFIVNLLNYFYSGDKIYTVFELLSETLHNYLMDEYPAGFSLNKTRDYSRQICKALRHLSDLNIIHGDLKLDNILLTYPEASTIKLVDFGSAFRLGEKFDRKIRARPYRSPELILKSSIEMPTDMWSLGCLMAEMYTANILFPGPDSITQINEFVEILGMPPSNLLDRSTRTAHFFETTSGLERYILKKTSNGKMYKEPGTRKMQDVLAIELNGQMFEKGEDDDNFLYEYMDFMDLIFLMLKYDPSERITPCNALIHKFLNSPEE